MHNVREQSWFVPVVLVAIVIGGLSSLMLFSTQVSGVLSTVGASVPSSYEGTTSDATGAETTGGKTGDGGTGDGGASNGGTGDGGTTGSASSDFVLVVARDDQLLIRNGTFVLEVGAIDAAVTTAANRIGALGGYAGGSDRSGTGDGAQATITYRIPAARWDEAVAAVRGLAIEVQEEKSTTEDVTSQVVDIGARIRNLQATEAALQKIMDRATVIKDVLTVQGELTTVRGHIEELTAQKAHLEAQAAFSTLTVTFTLEPTPTVVKQQVGYDPAVEVDRASATLVHVVQTATTAGIWFGIVWLPILGVLAIGGTVAFVMVRRVRRMWPRDLEPAEPAT
jgi:hypothetical protein